MRISPGIVALVLAANAAIPNAVLADQSSPDDHYRPYDHLFVIVEENEENTSIIGNPIAPTINSLANTYSLATQYFGTIHPSEGNYVGMVGGDSYGITDDAPYTTHTINQPSIVDLPAR